MELGPEPAGGRYGARKAGPDRLMRTDDWGAFFAVEGIGMPERALPYGSGVGCIGIIR